MMYNKFKQGALLIIPVLLQSCFGVDDNDLGPIIDPPAMILLKKDSLVSGKHYGIEIGQSSSAAYEGIKMMEDSLNVDYLNLVANFVTDFSTLKERLPLYAYMTFDQKTGTSNGVQLWFEDKKLKTIYLNSGQRLGRWPENISAGESVREGESVETAAEKLKALQSDSRYSLRFEHTMLGVKILSEQFDPEMKEIPQWYFGYKVDESKINYVHVHFKEDKVAYILVNHMRKL